MRQDRWLHWLLLAPALVVMAVMLYYPMLGTVYESFHETSFLNPDPKFVGFALYQRVLADGTFYTVLLNSIVWTLGVVLLQNILGFLTALLLNQQLPMQGVLRAIVLLPFILPGVVAAILWRFMYDPQLGLVNSLLLQVGLIDHSIAWLADSRMAMASVIVAAVWKGFPFSMLIYLAALQNVDQSQIEAATLDGAGPVRRLFDVTLPAIRDVVVVNIVLTLILTFNYFDIIWVLTKGGPQSATHIFPTKIFETGFGQFRFGEAATYGVFSILVLALLVALYAIVQGGANRRRAAA
ncbi:MULTISPECIES: sugar ABC transporter permease [unclassified Rhizobium]|jgi:multiple sugar transport system permease protein|uniref:carbohydrate ABC transporter permease n=1 Tax=unclassified Rhizobium TaxID=2613769 RepID=UPI000691D2CA|nr:MULTISPECIES: sugar ABC transporter permease [unclassified Rhizobium]MBN8948972.1 sugar ABC transporter permease [Rhizobium tropici]OJY63040.1 MAG: sugar ABC transporter permease [Rhizobium sp. 60-20]RKD35525.1 multiple sugar transport system permease protein [Rhizobium sp. WW_1]